MYSQYQSWSVHRRNRICLPHRRRSLHCTSKTLRWSRGIDISQASAQLVPKSYRAMCVLLFGDQTWADGIRVGWVTGYLNILGQVAGVASTEWGLAGMILAAVVVCREDYVIKNYHQFLLFVGLLIIHGFLK
jgi:hypothetical protein